MAHISLTAPMREAPRKGGWIARLNTALRLRRERLDLAGLSDAQLEDIGISRSDAIAEARRSGWDAPSHWHR